MRSSLRPIASISAAAALLGASLLATACGGGGAGDFSNTSVVSISTVSVPAGVTGQAYTAKLDAVFPHPPGQFVVSAGRLPPGLVMDNLTGAITGFPRQLGRFNFDVVARDGGDPSLPAGRDVTFSEAVRSYTLDVVRGAPNILPQAIPAAQYRRSYLYRIDVAGGTAPYTFTLGSGALPAGISLAADGTLGNFPTVANPSQGTPFQFDVSVRDAAGLVDAAHFSLSVVVLPLVILSSALEPVAQFFPCNQVLELASTGGGQPIVWSQVPPTGDEVLLADIGMEISADGHLCNSISSPGASVLGTHAFTIQVTDEAGQVMTRQYHLTVNPGPVLTGITPNRASQSGPFVVTGANFQPGAQLVFKPGATQVEVTPAFVSATELRFNVAPSAPGGAGGAVPVRVVNPDAGAFTQPSAFIFPAASISFGGKGFVSSDVSSTGLDCADVDGDGWADIVHCGASGFEAYAGSPTASSGGLVYHHNLATRPPTFASQTLSTSSMYDVKLVDVNLDGRLDIVGLGQASIEVFLNGVNGDPIGTFSAVPESPLPGGIVWPSQMTVGLFNTDLIPDVAFGEPNYPGYYPSGACHLMTGDGSGGFTLVSSATKSITDSYGVIALCSADSDGDGRDEICAGVGLNPYSGPMFNYNPLNSDGSFGGWAQRGGTITSPGYGSTTGIVAADFGGTGTSSIIAAMTGSPSYDNTRNLMMFSGPGFNSMTTIPAPAEVTKCLTAVDADFDTKLDFAVSTSPGSIQVYSGSTLTSAVTLDVSTGAPNVSSPVTGRMASGDLDNDGRPDVLVTTSYWACEGMASNHGSYYALGAVGDGGSKGVVFYLNTSN